MSDPRGLAAITDFPDVVASSVDGRAAIRRRKGRPDVSEGEWTKALMGRYEEWHDLVNLGPAESIRLETSFAPGVVGLRSRQSGFCRADAIVTHRDGRISIIEAKTSGEPTAICCAIGQLIYYKTLAETFWGAEVAALVLASRYLPELVLDCIVNVKAPICFLKATDDGSFYGLVPDYRRTQ